MKKTCGLILSIAVCASLTGCVSIGEYVAKSATYSHNISTSAAVSVNIESDNVVSTPSRGVLGAIGSTINIASAVGSAVMSSEQSTRLQSLIRPDVLATNVATGFEANFGGATHLQVVPNESNPDLRVILKINEFGLWADSLMSPIYFYVEAEVRIVYTPEMKTVYQNGITMSRSVSTVIEDITRGAADIAHVGVAAGSSGPNFTAHYAISNAANLIAGAGNLATFLKMSDADVTSVFNVMSTDAGAYIASELIDDIY